MHEGICVVTILWMESINNGPLFRCSTVAGRLKFYQTYSRLIKKCLVKHSNYDLKRLLLEIEETRNKIDFM